MNGQMIILIVLSLIIVPGIITKIILTIFDEDVESNPVGAITSYVILLAIGIKLVLSSIN